MITLTPAYGKDYKSKGEALKALHNRNEFIINEAFHAYDGKPCHIQDLPDGTIKLRWNSLKSVCLVNPMDFRN